MGMYPIKITKDTRVEARIEIRCQDVKNMQEFCMVGFPENMNDITPAARSSLLGIINSIVNPMRPLPEF